MARTVAGFAYRRNTDDDNFVVPEILQSQEYRFEFLGRISREKNLACFFDAGAHIGAFSWRLHHELKTVPIAAYEPEISNFHFLAYNTAHFPLIMIHQKAISFFDGDLPLMHASPEHTGQHRTDLIGSDLVVEAENINRLMNPFPDGSLGLKLDIEGYEAELLPKMDLKKLMWLVLEVHRSPLPRSMGPLDLLYCPFDNGRHGVYVNPTVCDPENSAPNLDRR